MELTTVTTECINSAFSPLILPHLGLVVTTLGQVSLIIDTDIVHNGQ